MDFRIVEVSNADKAMLEGIGRFRYDLWKGETEVNEAMFPEGIWLEDIDHIARHWVAIGRDDNELLGVARLTIHETLSDNPDGYWWIDNNLEDRVPGPSTHFCKLAVSPKARGLGIAKKLNTLRIDISKEMGAKSILVTASPINAAILQKLGFEDTGIRCVFPNRPKFEFLALHLRLD